LYILFIQGICEVLKLSSITQPLFFIGSGRCGTHMMEKLFKNFPNVEIHHEYFGPYVMQLAVRYYMGMVTLQEVCDTLAKLHGTAIYYCDKDIWGDSSFKLSYVIEGLNKLFPMAKFIYLVRDGRKVVSSFYHKLAKECYDDRSIAILQSHIDNPERNPAPPPEKKYWWSIPRPGTSMARKFRTYDRFQRICFHWAEINRFILEKLDQVDPHRKRIYKLENLVSDHEALKDMLDFLNLPYDKELFTMLQRPHNVVTPVDYPLSEEQLAQLMEIAGDMMQYFGYDKTEEYKMIYDVEGI